MDPFLADFGSIPVAAYRKNLFTAAQGEHGIVPQLVMVIDIFVPGAEREYPLSHNRL